MEAGQREASRSNMSDALAGLVGIAGFVASVAVVVWAIRGVYRSELAGWRIRAACGVVGATAGGVLSWLRYMPHEDLAIYGMPLPVAIFKREEGQWYDYPSAAPFFIIGLNFVLLFGLVHLVGYGVLALMRARQRQ